MMTELDSRQLSVVSGDVRQRRAPATVHCLRSTAGGACRRGYTLAELLIVMTIMLMLAVITLPAVKNIMQDGAVREASRQLNSYFAMAKARALNTGRPCGVMMICDPPLGLQEISTPGSMPPWPTKQITKMYLAEVPPPYSGGIVGARGRIMLSLNGQANTYEFHPLIFSSAAGGYILDQSELAILQSLIADGEFFVVRFDYKGAWFVCQRSGNLLIYQNQPGSASMYPGRTQSGSLTPLPASMAVPPIGSPPVSTLPGSQYQVMRLPRRIGNPLELTAGTCIDVAYCGIGPANMPTYSLQCGMYPALVGASTANYPGLFPGSPPLPQALQAISIMFQPDGGIDSVFLNNWFFTPATTVHLLVGRTDKINPPFGASTTSATGLNMFDPVSSNLADPLSLWVSIARSTGAVNTSDNLPPAASAVSGTSATLNLGLTQQIINPTTAAGQLTYLQYCRQQATNREQAKTQ